MATGWLQNSNKLTLLFLAGTALLSAQPADLIVHNGKIVTVDARFSIAQAMAVRAGRITAVGPNAEILRQRGPNTQVLDLAGKTVLPGLMDSHTHAADAAMYEFDHPINDMETMADVLAYVRQRAGVVPKGGWIRVAQVFITRIREQRYPTRAELDAAAPDHAVIFSTGPDAALNTRALRALGVDRNFKVPAGVSGKVEKDAAGEPTGMLRSYAQFLKIPPTSRDASLDERADRLKLLIDDYHSLGITGIADRDASDQDVAVYQRLKDRGQLTARVFLNYHIDPGGTWESVAAQIQRAIDHPLHKKDDFLWLRGLKAFLDGGMLTGSAYMREPWGKSAIYSITDDSYRGLKYIEPERLYQIAKMALANDLQFTAHSVGDGAVHALIDAYERVNRDFPVRDQRPCITHCNFMSPEAVERMAKIGIVADLQPAWLERDGATLSKHFGTPRLRYFQPYKSLFAAGVVVGGGSDHMQKIGGMRSVNPYHPFFGMWVALRRQPRWTSEPLHTGERISREQAIRLYTINNAILMFAEKDRGSLEKGKLADFAILTRDILTCPEDQIKDIQSEKTYVAGKPVFSR